MEGVKCWKSRKAVQVKNQILRVESIKVIFEAQENLSARFKDLK